MYKLDLCGRCAARLAIAYNIEKVKSSVNNKITCAQCGKRRYGATYTVDVKRDKEQTT